MAVFPLPIIGLLRRAGQQGIAVEVGRDARRNLGRRRGNLVAADCPYGCRRAPRVPAPHGLDAVWKLAKRFLARDNLRRAGFQKDLAE